MTMTDKIVVMQTGHIEQVGAPLELYDRPANVFVASFIGSPAMNLIDGRVVGGRVQMGDVTLDLPAGCSATDGDEVIFGIRPESFRPAGYGLSGVVAVVEPTGSETHVVVRMGARDMTAVFRGRVSFRPGDPITLAPDAGAAHIFSKATGMRLS